MHCLKICKTRTQEKVWGRAKGHGTCVAVWCVHCVAMCCSVLKCVAVRCSVLQCKLLCVVVCIAQPEPMWGMAKAITPVLHYIVFIVLQCVAVCCNVLQCAAVCCSVLQCVSRPEPRKRCELGRKAIAPVLQCVVSIVLQCVAVCWMCVAVCCSLWGVR